LCFLLLVVKAKGVYCCVQMEGSSTQVYYRAAKLQQMHLFDKQGTYIGNISPTVAAIFLLCIITIVVNSRADSQCVDDSVTHVTRVMCVVMFCFVLYCILVL